MIIKKKVRRRFSQDARIVWMRHLLWIAEMGLQWTVTLMKVYQSKFRAEFLFRSLVVAVIRTCLLVMLRMIVFPKHERSCHTAIMLPWIVKEFGFSPETS